MFPETIRNQFLTLWSTFITWRNSFFWGGCSSKHHTFFSTSYQTYSLPIWCFSLTAQDHLSGNVPQVNGMSLSIGQIIAISITATAASIGAAGIPQVNKRIWNGNGWKIMFPYFFSRLAWWRWWWCSRRWDFLLRTSPSSWPSTGSSTGYRWSGRRQLDTDVQFFASLFHGAIFPCSCTLVWWRRTENKQKIESVYRFRTTINVLGDSLGAGIVYHLSKDELDDFGKPPTKSVLSHLTLHLSDDSPSLEKIHDKLAPGTLMAALSRCQWPMLRRTDTRENETTEWEFWWGFLH